MDESGTVDDHQNQEIRNDNVFILLLSSLVRIPFRLLHSFSSITFSTLRPYAARIIPVLICLLFIPLVILLSISAGFVVWKNVAVDWETPIHLQFGDGMPPYASVSLPTLVSQQPYDISLRLTIPATESNYALGNFMTSLTLTTPSNKTLTSVRRPAIVFPAKSFFSRGTPSTVSLTVQMLSSFYPGSSNVVAVVEIGRRDHWTSLGKGEGREISIISLSIRGLVVHRGIRGLISRFPITFASLSAVTFLLIVSLILAACTLSIITQRRSDNMITSSANENSNSSKRLSLPRSRSSSLESDEKPLMKRRRTKPSRNNSRRLGVKKVVSTSLMPSASVKSEPLRRRRSRSYQGLSDPES